MDTSIEKGFGGVDIAHTHRNARIHEEVLDRPATAPGPLRQEVARERRLQRFDAEMPEVPVGLQTPGRQSEDQTESSGIAKPELLPGSQGDSDMFVCLAYLARLDERQSTTHPQMHNKSRVPFDMEQEVFRPTGDLENPAPHHPATESPPAHGLAQGAAPHSQALDPLAADPRFKAAAQHLDLR
jgi:hypothetical protein